nr:reverse transcriptase domain-containing protein [Tanacetum cinerariifolium]
MTKLTQKNVKFECGDKSKAAFQLLKQKLCNAPILALPEGVENFIVYCDVSHKGLGAVLMQNEKTTYLKNEITRFNQKFEETFGEAWERFKEMLRQCPYHGFLELHQIDTLYNGLNKHEKDSLNAAVGENLLSKTPRDALTIIENKSKVCNSRNKPVSSKVSTTSSGSSSSMDARIDKLTDTISNLVETFNKKMTSPDTVKAIEETCVTCGDAHPYYDCIATDSNTSSACTAMDTYNHGGPQNRASNQMGPPRFPPVQNNNQKCFNQNQRNNVDRGNNFQGNQGSGPLPSNTIANPRGDLKAITTRSGVSYEGPPIPPPFSSLPKVVERVPKVTKDTVQPNALLHMPKFALMFKSLLNNKEKLFDLDTTSVNENCSVVILKKLPKKLRDPDKFLIPCDFPKLVECLALADLAITFKVRQTSKYSYNDAKSINQIGDIDVACEEYVQEVLGFLEIPKSGNPTPTSEPIIAFSSPSFTLFKGSDFILEEIKIFLRTPDELPNLDDDYYDTEGDIIFLEKLLNDDSSPNLPPVKNEDLKQVDATMTKPSIEEPPKLELKELPQWVSPVHCVPKKGGMTVIENEDNELIPTRLVTGWRVCIDYRKLNDATRKDHFRLSFMDQMLERLARNEFYCFLDGFSRYFQILIDPQDQEKTTFTCPYGMFSYRHAQAHYTTTEIELLTVVYAFEKFRPYLVLSKTIVYTDHSALKYLLGKQDAKPRLLWWILLLQEFDVIICDKKGAENLAADHLSRLENPHQDELEKKEITESFPLETLGMIAFRGDSSTHDRSPLLKFSLMEPSSYLKLKDPTLRIALDLEASRVHGFVLHSLELQSLAYGNSIS